MKVLNRREGWREGWGGLVGEFRERSSGIAVEFGVGVSLIFLYIGFLFEDG